MKRTQIYLPEHTHQTLLRLAQKRKVSFAQIVRVCIDREMGRMDTDYSGKKTMQAITRLGARGGPKDLSANLDRYLYDRKTKKSEGIVNDSPRLKASTIIAKMKKADRYQGIFLRELKKSLEYADKTAQ